MAQHSDDNAFQQRMKKLESLLAEIDSFADPKAQAKTREIIENLMDFHGTALAKILDCLTTSDSGHNILKSLCQDSLVSSLLILYGLHPLDLASRVAQALDKVRPYLATHHGNVELLTITDAGAVQLRLQGSCHGCPSSQATLKGLIEEALYAAAPDITDIIVEGVLEEAPSSAASGFVAVSEVRYHGCPTSAATPLQSGVSL